MSTTFRPHPNNVSTALAGNYTAGSGSLVLAAGSGAAFGSTFPLTVTVAQAANVGLTTEVNTIFTVTGRSSDTLTGVSATEGTTDRNYAIGDRVECRWTGGNAGAIEAAVNGVENSTGITGGVIAPARLGSGTPGTANFLRGDGTWFQVWCDANTTRTTNYTMAATDTFVACNSSAGAFTVTLPAASGAGVNQEYLIFKTDTSANAVTIARAGTDVFGGGATSVTLNGQNKFVRLIARTGVWFVVGSN